MTEATITIPLEVFWFFAGGVSATAALIIIALKTGNSSGPSGGASA